MAFNWLFGGLTNAEAPVSFQAGSLAAGRLFGERFRILETLGAGGMGQVFRAHDLTTQRDVALKVMRKAVGERQRVRFLREGELTAKLDHPGILKIHGGGVTVEGCPFLVLELVEGARTLHEVLVEDFERGLHLLYLLARAVGDAHAQGVVHRDLKPDNILVDASGRLRVCDFGIAFSSVDEAERLTRTGELVGTLAYMPPECFSGKQREVEPTADVWALGAILYEHLTGKPPFAASTLAELIAQMSTGRVRAPRELRPDVPPAVEAVCLRALASDPRERFQDGDAFADALELASSRGGQRRRRRPLASASAALLLAGGLLAVYARPGGAQRVPSEARAPSAIAGEASSLALAPFAPVKAERALADLLREAHEPTGLRQEVLDGFERVALLTEGQPALAARVRLERLEYLFRRGRWEQVVSEAARLEREPGRIGAQAALLQVLAVNQLRVERHPAAGRAVAACRARWERPASERGPLELACGAWAALYDGKPKVAIERAGRAQRLDPELLAAILVEAVAWGRLLDIPKAQALAARARDLVPDHPIPLLLLSVCQSHLLKHEESLALSGEALALVSPEPPWAAYRLHLYGLFALKRYRAIDALAEQRLRESPADPHWRFVQGFALVLGGGGRWRGGQILRRVRQTAPESFRLSMDAFVRTGREKLERNLDALSEAQLQVRVTFERAMTLRAAGDSVRRAELLRESAAAGYPPAMVALGQSYSLGRGVPRDDHRALVLYRKAVAAGRLRAAYFVGVCYTEGRGVARDRAQAVRWYRKAAEAGHPVAARNLALCYAKGLGVDRDRAQALRWYLVAAEGGDAVAMFNLGNGYRRGWGDGPDEAQAAEWLRRAADSGKVDALLNLGKLHFDQGAWTKAARCWSEAQERGDAAAKADAARNLELLRRLHPDLR